MGNLRFLIVFLFSLVFLNIAYGQEKEFLSNGGFESGKAKWVSYCDAAGVRPVDGIGGGVANLTVTSTTTSPLKDKSSGLLTKDATNRQGCGISTDFVIDNSLKAKVMQIDIDYQVNSGTFVAGSTSADSDVIVYIYNVTDGVLLEPSSIKLLSNSSTLADKFTANFQTSATATTYRLILHAASTSASAYSLKFEASVKPSKYVYGTPITDWVSYTYTGFTSTNGVVSSKWRRVGDTMEIQQNVEWSNTAGAFSGVFGLPSGYSIDTSKLGLNTLAVDRTLLGRASFLDSGAFIYDGLVTYRDTTTVNVWQLDASASTGRNAIITATSPFSFGTNDTINLKYSVPITGWSSSTQMSDSVVWDDDVGQVQAFAFSSTTPPNGWLYADGSAVSRATYADLFKKIGTTFGAGDGSTTFNLPDMRGIFVRGAGSQTFGSQTYTGTLGTKQNDGFEAHSHSITDPGHSHQIQNTQDGNSIRNSTTGALSGWVLNFSGTNNGAHNVIAQAGGTNITGTNNTGGSETQPANIALTYFIKYTRGVSPVISATEVVAARYITAAAQSMPNNVTTIIDFGVKDFDTHNAVTTGASWKFTAPISGIYEVSGMNTYNTGGGWGVSEEVDAILHKNGNLAIYLHTHYMQSAHTTSVVQPYSSTQIRLNAGDYIDIRGFQNSGASLALVANSGLNWISIKRVGNY